MRKSLLSLAAAAGIAGAIAAPLPQPAAAASLLPAPAVAAATPAIDGPGDTATVQKVWWYYYRPGYRVWRPGPVVVVHPYSGGWWYGGHYYYHRAWGGYGWRYW
ncbi:MAG TPA: hypothetical protein VJY39_05085 [Acidisphaera sp.]|nr:hypothetical protein [Acidisphaera sp.]